MATTTVVGPNFFSQIMMMMIGHWPFYLVFFSFPLLGIKLYTQNEKKTSSNQEEKTFFENRWSLWTYTHTHTHDGCILLFSPCREGERERKKTKILYLQMTPREQQKKNSSSSRENSWCRKIELKSSFGFRCFPLFSHSLFQFFLV